MESNSDFQGIIGPKAALQAVKQDPAVLDVQLSSVDSNRNSVSSPVSEHLPSIPEHSAKENNCKSSSSSDISDSSRFEEMVRMQKAALLSLAPEKLEMLLVYAGLLRKKRQLGQKHFECAFCKNNGEPPSWYSSHVLKDKRGRVRCPVLRGYRCPACGATGDRAHTIKYCPDNNRTGLWSR